MRDFHLFFDSNYQHFHQVPQVRRMLLNVSTTCQGFFHKKIQVYHSGCSWSSNRFNKYLHCSAAHISPSRAQIVHESDLQEFGGFGFQQTAQSGTSDLAFATTASHGPVCCPINTDDHFGAGLARRGTGGFNDGGKTYR